MSPIAANDKQPPEPTEVVYLPAPSWKPALIALSLLAILAGTFMGTIYVVAGAVVGIPTLIAWIRDSRRRFSALPLQQPTTTAVVPPLAASESATVVEPVETAA